MHWRTQNPFGHTTQPCQKGRPGIAQHIHNPYQPIRNEWQLPGPFTKAAGQHQQQRQRSDKQPGEITQDAGDPGGLYDTEKMVVQKEQEEGQQKNRMGYGSSRFAKDLVHRFCSWVNKGVWGINPIVVYFCMLGGRSNLLNIDYRCIMRNRFPMRINTPDVSDNQRLSDSQKSARGLIFVRLHIWNNAKSTGLPIKV